MVGPFDVVIDGYRQNMRYITVRLMPMTVKNWLTVPLKERKHRNYLMRS